METEETKGYCGWKVVSIVFGCIEILLSIGFGSIFGLSNAVFGEYQTVIVIFLICVLNVIASIIWMRGVCLEDIRFLLTAVVWWMASLGLWLLWMILDVISGVEFDKAILVTTGLIVICHLSTAMCYLKLRSNIVDDEIDDPRINVSDIVETEEFKELNA